MNELFLAATLLLSFGGTIVFLKVFGKGGLFAWIGICTLMANIEVTLLVRAFGMDQTLGNTLFAATFLATDVLSEIYGKKEAHKGVLAGIFTNVTFILLSLMWIRYIPAEGDWASGFVRGLFSNTPRMLTASLLAYVVSEWIDVNLYHAWWKLTEKKVRKPRQIPLVPQQFFNADFAICEHRFVQLWSLLGNLSIQRTCRHHRVVLCDLHCDQFA